MDLINRSEDGSDFSKSTSGSVFTREKTSHVFLSHRELRRQRSSGCRGRRDPDQGEALTRTAVRDAPHSVCRGGWGSRLNASSYRGDILLDGAELHLGELAMIAKPNPLYGSLYFMVIPIAPMVVFQLADDHNAPTHELR